MRAVGLLGDQVGLLPAGYRGRDRLLLHPVQKHMDGLRDSAIGRIREYQHTGLDCGIIKGTGERQLHDGDCEVLDPAVAVGIGDLKLDGIRARRQIFRHIHRYAALGYIQNRTHHVVDPDRQRPVARGHVVLNGRPGDGQCQGITGSDGPAHKARGIVHGDHGGIGRLCAATSAASPEAGKGSCDNFTAGCEVEGIVLHISTVHFPGEDQFQLGIALLDSSDRLFHASHFVDRVARLLERLSRNGIRRGSDVGNLLGFRVDRSHGCIPCVFHISHSIRSCALHSGNSDILGIVDLILGIAYHALDVGFHTGTGCLHSSDLCISLCLDGLDSGLGSGVDGIVEACHSGHSRILCVHRIVPGILCCSSIFLRALGGCFRSLGQGSHIRLRGLGDMKRLDDIVRIGKDLLNLHDLRSGFQRIVVQRGSFNIQIEVGAGQVIF